MSIQIGYTNNVKAPQGGVNGLTGQGQTYQFTLTFAGASGGQVTITLTSQTNGVQSQFGYGNVTGKDFNYCQTFNNKVYGLAGGTVYTSAINAPTVWNDPNATGNGYVTLSNWFASTETLAAMSPYQGRLVFLSRRNVQIWLIDPNLLNWTIIQTLTNIGTLAPLSVQSLGDLDVLFLSDTGLRSLRVRDNTLNAFVTDIGSPVDTLIQTALLAGNGSAACGIVEPEANRYWCYLNGVIYVLSFFPSNMISAWGTYLPTYPNVLSASGTSYSSGGAVTVTAVVGRSYLWTKGANDISISDGTNTYTSTQSFFAKGTTLTLIGTPSATVTATVEEQTPWTPSKFAVYNGQVYGRDTGAGYLFGGSGNNTYDGTIAVASTSWLELKTPGTRKTAQALDSAFTGAWQFLASMDWAGVNAGAALQNVTNGPINAPTFQLGQYPISDDGFHIKLSAQSSGNTACVLSSLVFHYLQDDEK